MQKTETTRSVLISAAGELFAEHGFDGVSTRMIADRAGVKVSAIHYHFGSKEKLYIETCLSAHAKGVNITFTDVFQEYPNLIKTAEGQSEIIRTTIFRNYHNHFRTDRPEWESRILLQEIAAPSNAMTALVDLIYRPTAESAASFYKLVRPEASEAEAAAWSDLLYAGILFYSMTKKTIAMVRGNDSLTTEFYHTAAAKLARAMILEAGLPLPADLQEQRHRFSRI